MSVDFPRAWQIARSKPYKKHHENCSYRTTKGAFLCDCDVLMKHPDMLDDVMQGEETEYKCMACGQTFTVPRSRKTYVRHERHGGCTWGIGKKSSARKGRQ